MFSQSTTPFEWVQTHGSSEIQGTCVWSIQMDTVGPMIRFAQPFLLSFKELKENQNIRKFINSNLIVVYVMLFQLFPSFE